MINKKAIYKLIPCMVFAILCKAPVIAQMGNNWCFGKYAGINFSTNPPTLFHSEIKDTIPGQTYTGTAENPVTVSNCQGKLWFYGEAVTIWNRYNQIMPHGSLKLNYTGNQSFSLAIPKPMHDSEFYYITSPDYGYYYTTVDMRKDSGRGDVDTNIIQLVDSFTAFQTGVFVKHANDTDYWLILQTGNYNCKSYLVTKDSICRIPVISDVYGGQYSKNQDMLKATRDGNQLIGTFINSYPNYKTIYDIDRKNGKIKNPKELIRKVGGVNYLYDVGYVEVSPNDSLIYFFYGDNQNAPKYREILCQIRRFATKPYNTIKYVDTLYYNWHSQKENDIISSIKLAPNNKIYMLNSDSMLHVIHYPDRIGKACKLERNIINIAPAESGYNLPCMDFPIKKMNFVIGMPSNTCGRDSVYFSINTDSMVKSVTWYFGDGDSSTALNPIHVYNKDGKYHIQLKAETGANGCGYYQWFSDSLYLKIKPYLGLTKDTTYYTCGSNNIQVKLKFNHSDTVRFHWGDNTDTIIYSNNKSAFDSIVLYHNYTTGSYIVSAHVWNSNCEDSMAFNHQVNIDPKPIAYFTPNYPQSCGNSTITFTDSSGGMDSIIQQRKWTISYPNNIVKQYDTVSTNKLKLIVQDTGYYSAKLIYITQQGCMDSLTKTNVFRILPQPVVYIDSPSHNPLCFGDSFILIAKQKDINYPPLVTYKWNAGLVNTPSITVDSANSYYVSATNTYGCGAQSNTVKITFLPQLFTNIKTAKDSLYTISTRPIISYTWYKDTVFYSNTSSLYHPPTGRYYVHVMDVNGCVANSGSLLHIGLNHIENIDNFILVYPNPVSDVLYVEVAASAPLSYPAPLSYRGQIVMYDVMGRSVLQMVCGDTNHGQLYSLNVRDLPKGLYILSVRGEKVKVVIE